MLEMYFAEHNLWDLETLKKHCEEQKVEVTISNLSPNVVMLHYSEEAHFEQSWTEFSRQCRGLIVDLAARKILAHPFNKFFNIGEQPETDYKALEALGKFEVSEKLDGSMCILYKDPTTNTFRLTTKGSFASDHGQVATEMLPEHLKNDFFVDNYTLIFELVSHKPEFRIVVDYAKKGYPEGLYLIGVRYRPTGQLLSYWQVQEFAMWQGLQTANIYSFESLDALIKSLESLPVQDEGYVLRFENGHMAKAKGAKYLQAHKFISRMSPKYILEALGDGTIQDLLHAAPEEYREDVQELVEEFSRDKAELTEEVFELFEKAPKESRKEFALWIQQNSPPELKSFLFTLFDKKPLQDSKIYAIIGEQRKISGATKI